MRIKKILKNAIIGFQFHQLLKVLNRRKVVLLTYHGFYDEDKENGLELFSNRWTEIRFFKKQISYLTKYYNIISLDNLISHYIEGISIPRNSVVITMDDGYKSNYNLAYPYLKEQGCNFTVFLSTKFIENNKFNWPERVEYSIWKSKKELLSITIDRIEHTYSIKSSEQKIFVCHYIKKVLQTASQQVRERVLAEIELHTGSVLEFKTAPDLLLPLSWEEIVKMCKSNLALFGSHTVSHPNLTTCSILDIKNELLLSRNIIQKRTNKLCEYFCYPGGAYNKLVKKIVEECGYKCALAVGEKFEVMGTTDLYEIKRKSVGRNMTDCDFKLKLSY
jgi:peptidoglycan/xylan/chitin deacetylase (PgdA/CDA1 family)